MQAGADMARLVKLINGGLNVKGMSSSTEKLPGRADEPMDG